MPGITQSKVLAKYTRSKTVSLEIVTLFILMQVPLMMSTKQAERYAQTTVVH